MKNIARFFPAVFLALALAGCKFDHPLTDSPSKGINTWLLGVWEAKDDDGRVTRVKVAPVKSDLYSVQVTETKKNQKEPKRYEFQAWPSRVGGTLFLSLRCVSSPGDVPAGSHVFAQVQLLGQNDVRVHGLSLDSSPAASSYELRKEVRAKLKDRSLYEGAPSVVGVRVEEVVWSADGSDPTFKPIRNPNAFAWGANDNVRDRNRKLFGGD